MDKDIHINFSTSIIQSVLFCGDAVAPLLFSLSLSVPVSALSLPSLLSLLSSSPL